MKISIFIELLKQDLKHKYLGSLLGVVWAFLVPLATIIIMWLVFEYGFNRKEVDGYPYIIWFGAGIIPWLYISDALSTATSSIKQKAFLIKKTTFNPIYLPIIKIISNLTVHIVLVLFLLILLLIYHIGLSIYNLQILYYMFCMVFLIFTISLITSSLVLFLPDISEIVNLVLRFGFWLTPIFWNPKVIPEKYRYILDLNPFYYIIQGYRDALIYHKWFFNKIESIIFLGILLFMFVIGYYIFNRLKIHFGDVI